MSSVPANDRRRSHRRWTAVPVTIWSHGTRFDGTTINVSEGGMYFFAAADLAVGDQMEIQFRPPGAKKTIRICGVVRRRALYLYGIEYTSEVVTTGARMPLDADEAYAITRDLHQGGEP